MFQFVTYMVPLMHMQLMHHPRTCASTNGVQQPVHSAPSVSSIKKVQVLSPSYVQSKARMNHPYAENFLAIGGYFECYTLRYSTRLPEERKRTKKKERKKMNNSDFQLFQVCHFKIVTTRSYYYCRLGQAL